MVNASALGGDRERTSRPRSASSTWRSTCRRGARTGGVFDELEASVDLNRAEERARTIGAHMMMIDILPTVDEQRLRQTVQPQPALPAAQRADLAARGKDLKISIGGVERLATFADTIAARGGLRGVQLHRRSTRGLRGRWDAAQAIAGPQVAMRRNSTFFFGRGSGARRASRCSSRPPTPARELEAQGVRPRVWFGERWITWIFDLFEEDVRFFQALLPSASEEDPVGARARRAPELDELRLPDGTICRWDRPIYDAVGAARTRASSGGCCRRPDDGRHCANAGFYYGLVRTLMAEERPLVTNVVLSRRGELPHRARDRVEAHLLARRGEVPAPELVLAAAAAGARGLEGRRRRRRRPRPAARIIERRCMTMRTAPPGRRPGPPPLRRRGAGSRRGAAADDRALPGARARERAGATSPAVSVRHSDLEDLGDISGRTRRRAGPGVPASQARCSSSRNTALALGRGQPRLSLRQPKRAERGGLHRPAGAGAAVKARGDRRAAAMTHACCVPAGTWQDYDRGREGLQDLVVGAARSQRDRAKTSRADRSVTDRRCPPAGREAAGGQAIERASSSMGAGPGAGGRGARCARVIWSAHPGFPATTASAPVSRRLRALRSPSSAAARAASGCRRPPSRSRAPTRRGSTISRPGIPRRSSRGWARTPWAWARWQASW